MKLYKMTAAHRMMSMTQKLLIVPAPLPAPSVSFFINSWQRFFFQSLLASLWSSLSAMVAGEGEEGQEGAVSK